MLKSLIRKFKVSKLKLINNVVQGESTELLLSKLEFLTTQERSNLLSTSLQIIKQCLPPNFNSNNKSRNTGIIIGKIQSGKTLSFTSAIALAQDNGYKVVVIISGRTNLLLKQTKDRLRKDFKNDNKVKIHKINSKTDFNSLTNAILKPFLKPKRSKLNVIPILKHQDALRKVSDLFSQPIINSHLCKNTVLIIDDEADQASLNTYARSNAKKALNDASAIFSSIRRLRNSCPNHTYLQYTATPQANLLIDSLSLLSPDWHVLLSPGKKYTGGNSFFKNQGNLPKLYGSIPIVGSYPPDTKSLESPPESYIDAIKEFMMLCSLMSGRIKDTKEYNLKGSMLVHPTHFVNESKTNPIGIKKFAQWCINIKDSLESLIDSKEYYAFENLYNKLKLEYDCTGIFNSFPSLDDIIDDIEYNIIDEILISRVTGGMLDKEEGYPWEDSDYHILLGGALLDRGFTVENLILTYMPRDSKSLNQSDTIEQRCRFYGYRSEYLAFCRVYLNEGIIRDFKNYNEFEDFLHNYLSKNSLKEFYKNGSRLLLDKGLLPTNMSRISETLVNTHLQKWQYFELQEFSFSTNNQLIEDFINRYNSEFRNLIPKNKEHRQKNYQHRAQIIQINEIEDLMVEFRVDTFEDKIKKDAMISFFEILQENDGVKNIWVIEMAPQAKRERTITPKKTKTGDNIFVMSSLQAGDGRFGFKEQNEEYFGDRKLIKQTHGQTSETFDYDDEPIVQLHKIYVGERTVDDIKINGKRLKGQFFYTLAIYFPEKYRRNFIQKIKLTV